MGIIDKITGRAKQAAGDIVGDESLRREGVQEERKGEAKDALRREQARADVERERADAEQEAARQRAAGAAQREFDKSRERIDSEEARAEAAEARAERRAGEVEELEHRTDAGRLAEDRTREELYEEARELGVEGRSDMTKDELADEIRTRK
jgi:uncharacterized protein YjbJ (UPF0337 family)